MEKLIELEYPRPAAQLAGLLKKIRRLHPATLLAASFVMAILAGAALLMLPAATVSGKIALIDALFTATSAVCVTGLTVVNTGSYFTRFGQSVILALIQIGGLGVMTISVTVFSLIGKSISIRQRMIMQDVFSHTPREDILQVVKSIFLFTGIVELLGTGLLFIHWAADYPVGRALYLALFHSVSAFCNAGFSTFSNSMTGYRQDLLLNASMCLLIVLGGIGFPVLYDLFRAASVYPRKRYRLSVQTKTVLSTTFLLILGGALLFGVLERNAVLQGSSVTERILASVFQSITSRTAGFNTVDIGALNPATLAMLIFLMFVGASPGSCGGGVKTTSLAAVGAYAWSRIRNRFRVNLFKRSLPFETVIKSASLILAALGLIAFVLFMLLVTVPSDPTAGATMRGLFLPYLFEAVSAFGTVGLSMGATATLTGSGKFWIMLLMLIGRVGLLTFSYVISGAAATNGREYAEENMMIG
ncbi:MAG: potassium transporter TrkG [Thermodesulfobacteriota bacterium]